jgi:hypothetical protein
MYTDAGKHFCNRDQNASQGYETKDAELFASWDADYLKVDACGTTVCLSVCPVMLFVCLLTV